MFFEDRYEAPGWPRDMIIRVSTGSNLLELLWLRHHALANTEPALPQADLPGEPVPSTDAVLLGIWERLWKESLDHARVVHETDSTSIADHAELWTPPRSAVLVDALGLDPAEGVRDWEATRPLYPDAERAVVDEVRRAWLAGLRVVIEIPLQAHYFRALSPSTVLVSARTRRDRTSYIDVLAGIGLR